MRSSCGCSLSRIASLKRKTSSAVAAEAGAARRYSAAPFLEASLDVEVDAPSLLRVETAGDVESNEAVHEG